MPNQLICSVGKYHIKGQVCIRNLTDLEKKKIIYRILFCKRTASALLMFTHVSGGLQLPDLIWGAFSPHFFPTSHWVTNFWQSFVVLRVAPLTKTSSLSLVTLLSLNTVWYSNILLCNNLFRCGEPTPLRRFPLHSHISPNCRSLRTSPDSWTTVTLRSLKPLVPAEDQ